jgi:hypothetical protein
MRPIWKFRAVALFIVLVVGGLSISSLLAELLRPSPFPLPSRTARGATPDQLSFAALASTIAPFRSDLMAEHAMALAGEAMKADGNGQTQNNARAQEAVRSALKIGPHDSRMWFVLSLLQARGNLGNSLIDESLKMSYLTGPNRAELIPYRLDSVTISNSLNDVDLSELARSDVRAILMHYPAQRPSLKAIYARASAVGKKFVEDSTRMIDPDFANSLR